LCYARGKRAGVSKCRRGLSRANTPLWFLQEKTEDTEIIEPKSLPSVSVTSVTSCKISGAYFFSAFIWRWTKR